jgi:hypothetical protein
LASVHGVMQQFLTQRDGVLEYLNPFSQRKKTAPRSVRSRSKIRLALCRCLRGTNPSASSTPRTQSAKTSIRDRASRSAGSPAAPRARASSGGFPNGGPPRPSRSACYGPPPTLSGELSPRFQGSCTPISLIAHTGFRPTLLPYRFSGGVYRLAFSFGWLQVFTVHNFTATLAPPCLADA